MFKARLERRWYSDAPPPALLRPLSALFGAVAAARRKRLNAAAEVMPVPVIVIGNLSVGGTGKTPFTIWLGERLREWGWRPGVVSRGYGGRSPVYPLRVAADTDPAICGDEPALIARRLRCPVVVSPDRVEAARRVIERDRVDIVIADDGLQHYRLARDLEICVVDGSRGLGNGALLPAGPLREALPRLDEVDLVVANGAWPGRPRPAIVMHLEADSVVSLDRAQTQPLSAWRGRRVHAVAGIGNPERFFRMLEDLGIDPVRHPFPDHHRFHPSEIQSGDGLPVLMTEKDAVKCTSFAWPDQWFVPVSARLTEEHERAVRELIQTRIPLPHG